MKEKNNKENNKENNKLPGDGDMIIYVAGFDEPMTYNEYSNLMEIKKKLKNKPTK